MITPLQINDKVYNINHDLGQYFEHQVKSIAEFRWYECPIPEVGVVIDAGANVGVYSLYMSEFAKTVYAIEPFTKSYDFLAQNIKENKKTNIKPYKFALTGTEGDRSMYTSYVPEDFSAFSLLPIGTKVETVKTKTIAQFIKEENIDVVHIMKCDIEGLEQEVFSADDFGDVAHKILAIVGEYHLQCPNLKEVLEYHGYDYTLNGVGMFTAIRKVIKKSDILLP